MPGCETTEGGVVLAGDGTSSDCALKQGFTVRFQQTTEEAEAQPAPAPEAQPSPRRSKRLKGEKMPNPVVAPEAESAPAPSPVTPVSAPQPESVPAPAPAAAPAVAPVAVQEHTTEPSVPSADDLTKVMGAAGGGGTGLVALVILVAGGAAGWKFWSKFSEQKHEQRMKQMEIDAQEKGLGNAQPIPCQSVAKVQAEAIATLKAQVEELQAKVGKVEKKTASFSGSFDAEELEEWQAKVDKDIKALKAKRAGV